MHNARVLRETTWQAAPVIPHALHDIVHLIATYALREFWRLGGLLAVGLDAVVNDSRYRSRLVKLSIVMLSQLRRRRCGNRKTRTVNLGPRHTGHGGDCECNGAETHISFLEVSNTVDECVGRWDRTTMLSASLPYIRMGK